MNNAQRKIVDLLDMLREAFPAKSTAIEKKLRGYGIDETVRLRIEPPEGAGPIPTFDSLRKRDATPMLGARFDYAGTIEYAGERWLPISEMTHWIENSQIIEMHQSIREYWTGSAPMLFEDEDLSLFGIYEGVPDYLIYLVWSCEKAEPEIWHFSGQEMERFKDLAAYIEWLLL